MYRVRWKRLSLSLALVFKQCFPIWMSHPRSIRRENCSPFVVLLFPNIWDHLVSVLESDCVFCWFGNPDVVLWNFWQCDGRCLWKRGKLRFQLFALGYKVSPHTCDGTIIVIMKPSFGLRECACAASGPVVPSKAIADTWFHRHVGALKMRPPMSL